MGKKIDEPRCKTGRHIPKLPFFSVTLSLLLVECFSVYFLNIRTNTLTLQSLWPLLFGALWAVILSGILYQIPRKAAAVTYGILYFAMVVYAGFQTGYYILFSEMMWLSDFRYASEGADYMDVLLGYPLAWWLGLLALLGLGIFVLCRFPKKEKKWYLRILAVVLAAAAMNAAYKLPSETFERDEDIKYAGSDYGRMQSTEAAYENMFSAHRLYQICGLYQTLYRDILHHGIYPLTPAYREAQEKARETIESAFAETDLAEENEMTGILKGKNVVLVLMESMDDWMIGEHTPTLRRMMEEGINFTRFYTPAYGGIRTFNTEFCINTGTFLSSEGGYAFDYVTNTFHQSLANLLREQGYSAKEFHYNTPTFYSRGVFSESLGYEDYVSYGDYVANDPNKKNLLYDDQLLFDNEALKAQFFREASPRLNFVITRSAHLSYKYNEVLSYWALKKYPEYKGLTGNEETDCAYVKARLVDDFFARMLDELEQAGELDNTVIIGVTDHYTYGYKDTQSLLELSGVDKTILLEKTPCFIWSPDLEAREVSKVLNTSDLLPTMLNMLGIDSPYQYIGEDAFDEEYEGYVPFANGSWICGDIAYDAKNKELTAISGQLQTVTGEFQKQMQQQVQEFILRNNLILKTDYYK